MASQFTKPKHVVPNYEELTTGIEYCFTFNPNDKLQYFCKPNRLAMCIHGVDEVLSAYSTRSYSLRLWPELSSKGRYHYHGNIIIYDKVEFYVHVIPHLMRHGTVHITEYIKLETDKLIEKKYTSWLDYCTKQTHFHNYLFNHYSMTMPIKLGIEKEVVYCDPDKYCESEDIITKEYLFKIRD